MISIMNMTKKFGDFTAVDNLSLNVPRGQLFCFLGPNGAGKTTTIKVLTGLLKPTDGQVFIDGKNVVEESVSARRIIGYVPDMPFLYDRLTPSEFLDFIGKLYNIPGTELSERKTDLLEKFGLTEKSNVLIKEFSHGMRQRLIYAATFLHQPKCLFIDEPLIGLDPYTIRLLKKMFRQYVHAGMTIFLTTHILALAQDIADRIGIISGGGMIALGTLTELRQGNADKSLEDIFISLTTGNNKTEERHKDVDDISTFF